MISCHRGKSPDSKKENIKKSIDMALSWVNKHPASFTDGMLIEILEEIITFYILSNYADKYKKDPSKKSYYIREIKKRLELIASKKDFKIQPVEYTVFLAVAAITEKLGLDTVDFKKIIGDQIMTDPHLYSQHITSQIWNTIYLERLGYMPPKSLEELLPQSTLFLEVHQKMVFQHIRAQFDPRYIDLIATTIYFMTHEIFPLTDFGKLPPPIIIVENQTFFSELFDQAIEWAITATHLDVLAEIIMCVKILNSENKSSLQHGIDYILSRQEKDGSFGITNPGRPNNYRHGTLVSIMALSMV